MIQHAKQGLESGSTCFGHNTSVFPNLVFGVFCADTYGFLRATHHEALAELHIPNNGKNLAMHRGTMWQELGLTPVVAKQELLPGHVLERLNATRWRKSYLHATSRWHQASWVMASVPRGRNKAACVASLRESANTLHHKPMESTSVEALHLGMSVPKSGPDFEICRHAKTLVT